MTRIASAPGRLLRSAGAKHGLIVGAAMMVAGLLDYGVSVMAGRRLDPVEFGVFVVVTAVLQVLLSVATAIRLVVALYTAELMAAPDAPTGVRAFLRSTAGWSSRWGLATAAVAALVSPMAARALRLPSSWPFWAASFMVLMLFVREATLGALQGVQAFNGLGVLQVGQAILRIALAVALIAAGAGAVGAIVAQPLAAIGAVIIGACWLRRYLVDAGRAEPRRVSWSYSASTVLGLALFGLITNLDAVFVKLWFGAREAGDYGTVVTFEKMSLFLPWAISFVLFPKATRRNTTGQDPRPILLVSLVAALLPGLALSAVYFLAPGVVVRAVFTSAYADPGVVLGLASLAGTLYAGLNIWLNYALSIRQSRFLYVLSAVALFQVAAMYAFGRGSLVAMTLSMVAAGLLGNAAGFLVTWMPARPIPSDAIASSALEGGDPVGA